MKIVWAAAILVLAVSEPVWAQDATAVGTGISASRSTANAGAVAIGGGNATAGGGTAVATGGAGGGGGAGGAGGAGGGGGRGVGVGTGGNPTASITTNNVVPSVTTTHVDTSGTSTVKNVPSVFAPGLAAAGLETCLGSVSAGAAVVGTGATFGTTIPDPGCAARLDARTLWSMGLKRAAIARLCLNSDIAKSMPDVCAENSPVVAPVYPSAYPAGVPYPPPQRSYVLSEGESYHGGLILLTDGSTGKERLCNDYDEARQRCRVWADVGTPEPKPHRKRLASVKVSKPTNAAASPTVSAPAKTETPAPTAEVPAKPESSSEGK